MYTKAMVPSRKHGPPSVINAGLVRTGTLSMARAYDILDIRAHHGFNLPEIPDHGGWVQWALLEKAAESTWPEAPGARKQVPRFTRNDWDKLFGEYDAITDVGSFFADQLIQAYPDAKVVIVQRDFDQWWSSFKGGIVDGLFHPVGQVLFAPFLALTGLRGSKAMQKMILGTFHARNAAEIEAHARETYDAYYERIRTLVPSERRLEFQLGDGWGPLCDFLGKDVPDVPFPRVNDKAEQRARQIEEVKDIVWTAYRVAQPWILGAVGVLALAVWLRLIRA